MSKKVMNEWFTINKSDDPKVGNEIVIYDEIGYDGYEWGVTLAGFKKEADEMEGDYTMRLHTPGGFVDTALAIYDYNKQRVAKGDTVNIIIDGDAASCGSFMALSGNERPEITENGRVMIHPVSGGGVGNIEDVEEAVEQMKKKQDRIKAIYMDNLGWTEDYTDELLSRGNTTWWHGQEAVDAGFARNVIKNPTIDLKNCWDEEAMSDKYEYELLTNKGDTMADNKEKRQRNTEDVEDAPVMNASDILASMQKMQSTMDDMAATNKKQGEELEALTAKNDELTTAISAKDEEIASTNAEKAEAERNLKKEEMLATAKASYNKLGKAEDVVDILMDVQDKCDEATYTGLTDLMAKANNIIMAENFDNEQGSSTDDEITEDTFIENKKKELMKADSKMTAYDATKEAMRIFKTEQEGK